MQTFFKFSNKFIDIVLWLNANLNQRIQHLKNANIKVEICPCAQVQFSQFWKSFSCIKNYNSIFCCRNSNKVSTIRFRCLTETDPETRLHRILHKKKFDEAFEFAKLFELNTEVMFVDRKLGSLLYWDISLIVLVF